MLRFFLNLFQGPPSTRKRRKRDEENTHNLIKRYGRGVSLQQGRYITEKDAKRLKDRILRCRF